jgi:hypothetical protein
MKNGLGCATEPARGPCDQVEAAHDDVHAASAKRRAVNYRGDSKIVMRWGWRSLIRMA